MPDTHDWKPATQAELVQGILCWYLARHSYFHKDREIEYWQACPVTEIQLLRRLERKADIPFWIHYVGKD